MPIAPDLNYKLKAIWHRICNAGVEEPITIYLLRRWADQIGLSQVTFYEAATGRFALIPVFVAVMGDVTAIFPKVPFKRDAAWLARREAVKAEAELWAKVEWFSPLWVPRGEANKILTDAKRCSKERALEMFAYHTSTLYTLPFEAVCIAQIMPQTRSLKEFAPLAREAFLAFFSGHRASSIAALIPAIEGGLSRIGANISGNDPLFVKIDCVIDRAIETAARMHFDVAGRSPDWIPPGYTTSEYLSVQDEVVFVFETFRRWLKDSFFQDTGRYDGLTWLNRHMFAHATHAAWQQPANFTRLIVALATMAFVESWHDETHFISPFFPTMNDDSRLLWQQALLQADIQMRFKLVEQQTYQKHGRLVPEMPTDDGILLRKALLTEDCMKELVSPLRDAGWSVEVGEADDRALTIQVSATAGERRLRVALLYSCATGNDIYRRLSETNDAILYRGAPYHQSQYAYGINVHVGPVLGWQPPAAPGGRPRRQTILRRRIRWLITCLLSFAPTVRHRPPTNAKLSDFEDLQR